MTTIKKIIEKIDYLPPFPATVARVLTMIRDPRVSPDVIADGIKFDQAIASQVLKLSNSSYFGLSRTVTNIREAVVFIGLKNLKKILILSGTQKYFDTENPGYETHKGELWAHGLAVSVLAGNVGNCMGIAGNDEVFIAALLHDIGKLVLNEFVINSYTDIMALVEKEGMSFLEAEKKTVGMDHAEIGARILAKWDFPDEIISAVRKHHTSLEEDDTDLDNAVRLADILSMMMGYETGVDGLSYMGFSDICRLYGMNHESLENIMAYSLEEIIKIEAEYKLTREE